MKTDDEWLKQHRHNIIVRNFFIKLLIVVVVPLIIMDLIWHLIPIDQFGYGVLLTIIGEFIFVCTAVMLLEGDEFWSLK